MDRMTAPEAASREDVAVALGADLVERRAARMPEQLQTFLSSPGGLCC